jgi:hypothetical protein
MMTMSIDALVGVMTQVMTIQERSSDRMMIPMTTKIAAVCST